MKKIDLKLMISTLLQWNVQIQRQKAIKNEIFSQKLKVG